MNKIVKLSYLVFVILLIGCDSSNNAMSESDALKIKILNNTWLLKSLENDTLNIAFIPYNQKYTLILVDTLSGGVNDCNEYSATYKESSSGNVSFTRFVTTKIYCGKSSLDDIYRDALEKVSIKSIENDQLIFRGVGNKIKMVFQKVAP